MILNSEDVRYWVSISRQVVVQAILEVAKDCYIVRFVEFCLQF